MMSARNASQRVVGCRQLLPVEGSVTAELSTVAWGHATAPSWPIPEAASGCFEDAQPVDPRLCCRAALEKSEGQLRVVLGHSTCLHGFGCRGRSIKLQQIDERKIKTACPAHQQAATGHEFTWQRISRISMEILFAVVTRTEHERQFRRSDVKAKDVARRAERDDEFAQCGACAHLAIAVGRFGHVRTTSTAS